MRQEKRHSRNSRRLLTRAARGDRLVNYIVTGLEPLEARVFLSVTPAGTTAKTGAVSGMAWVDSDGSGDFTQDDDGTEGYAGLDVQLLKADGTVVADVKTADDGTYMFSKVTPGQYFVQFDADDTLVLAPDLSDGLDVAAVKAGHIKSPAIKVAAAKEATGPTAAFLYAPSISGTLYGGNLTTVDPPLLDGWTVYLDTNSNGKLDKNEPKQVTDADGYFCFNGLNEAKYTVRAVAEGKYKQLPAKLFAQTVSAENNSGATADFYLSLSGSVSITGKTWFDVNGDGVFDEGDTPLASVYVEITNTDGTATLGAISDDSGVFTFSPVDAASYTLTYCADGFDGGGYGPGVADGMVTTEIDFAPGQTTATATAGFIRVGIISGRADMVDSTPLAERTVFIDADGNGQFDDGEISTTTNEDGWYDFTAIPLGQYRVCVLADDGVSAAGQPLSLTLDETNQTSADFSIAPEDLAGGSSGGGDVSVSPLLSGTVTLSDGTPAAGQTVFIDADGNGQFDDGEMSAATDENGFYAFDGLNDGTYTVGVIGEDGVSAAGAEQTVAVSAETSSTADFMVDATAVQTPPDSGGGGDPGSDPAGGDSNTGLSGLFDATVSGTLFLDTNGNGQRDAGEIPLAGWSLASMLNRSSFSACTDADGRFTVGGLSAGDDLIAASGPLWSCPVLLALHVLPHQVQQIDLAVPPNPMEGSIFGALFIDSNGDGVRQDDEVPAVGVTVTLTVADGDGVLTAQSADDGSFAFHDLGQDVYTVSAVGGLASCLAPFAAVAVSAAQGDAFVSLPVVPLTTITGRIYDDANANGVQDPGEAGKAGCKVTIRGRFCVDVWTDADGTYIASDQPAGWYWVKFRDENSPYTLDSIGTVVVAGQDNRLDIGMQPPPAPVEQPGTLSGIAFVDTKRNGVLDPGEELPADTAVTLDYFAGPWMGHQYFQVTTDDSGHWSFAASFPGVYTIRSTYFVSTTGGTLVGGRADTAGTTLTIDTAAGEPAVPTESSTMQAWAATPICVSMPTPVPGALPIFWGPQFECQDGMAPTKAIVNYTGGDVADISVPAMRGYLLESLTGSADMLNSRGAGAAGFISLSAADSARNFVQSVDYRPIVSPAVVRSATAKVTVSTSRAKPHVSRINARKPQVPAVVEQSVPTPISADMLDIARPDIFATAGPMQMGVPDSVANSAPDDVLTADKSLW